MEGIRSGLFRGGVRGRPRGSTRLLDGVEVDAAFEGLVVTGGPNFTSKLKPSWHSSRTSPSGSSRSTARAACVQRYKLVQKKQRPMTPSRRWREI